MRILKQLKFRTLGERIKKTKLCKTNKIILSQECMTLLFFNYRSVQNKDVSVALYYGWQQRSVGCAFKQEKKSQHVWHDSQFKQKNILKVKTNMLSAH